MKIGLLDSGIGGLTVLHQALLTLPEEDYLYYADTDHVPYGTKSKSEIIRYVDEAVSFLVGQGVDAVVIACNTATSAAAEYVRERYNLPILGMEPAVKPAVKNHSEKRILIIATPLTVKEEKLKNLIRQVDEDHKVDLLPLPKLVNFAEAGIFENNEVEEYLSKELSQFQLENYSTVVLGCTHFNYFKDTLQKIFQNRVEFIDGAKGTMNYLKSILSGRGSLGFGSSIEYYETGRLITDTERLKFYEVLMKRLDKMITI